PELTLRERDGDTSFARTGLSSPGHARNYGNDSNGQFLGVWRVVAGGPDIERPDPRQESRLYDGSEVRSQLIRGRVADGASARFTVAASAPAASRAWTTTRRPASVESRVRKGTVIQMDQPARRGHFELGCLDAVTWLRGLAAESVDLIVTDPPYESLEKYRAGGTT